MIALSSKQEKRNEKKRRKMTALANLINLNDQDRLEERKKEIQMEEEDSELVNDKDDGFTKVTHKKKPAKSQGGDGPNSKRLKIENVDGGHASDTSSVLSDDELKELKKTLTEVQYKEVRRQLRARKRELGELPAVKLREFGEKASLQVPQEQRTPIFLTDIQHLLMQALIGKKSPCSPERWCYLDKPLRLSHSIVVILEGISLFHYLANETKFEETNKIFTTRLELMLPPHKEGMIIEEIAQVPLTNVQAEQLILEHGSLESAVDMTKDPTLLVKAIFPMESQSSDTPNDLPPGDKFPRTKLLLSALQMVDEGYPMPLRGELQERFKSYVYTKTKYTPVTDHSPMFGVDCEMCRTTAGYNELTRISIVDEKLDTVYETLVLPHNRITDYLTSFSGITAELMKTVTKTLKDVQKEVRALLPPDAILVGQSLNSDLNAMQMMHPYVIDTSVCFNLCGMRKRKAKLRTLAMTFLKEVIQENSDGHDSVEDSLASLKLVKLKLANSLEFGDEILTQRKRIHEIIRLANGDNITNNLFAVASQRDKRTAVVTAGTLPEQAKDIFRKAEAAVTKDSLKSVTVHELDSNKQAVKKAREIALEHSLTLVNLKVSPQQLRGDQATEETVNQLDKWIGKLWKTTAHNGMMLVMMGGTADCPSGAVKIAIKKSVAGVAATAPIAV